MLVCKYKETKTFHFHNANPKGKNANDCVARAISVALDKSWEETIRDMTEHAIKLCCVFNEDKCIDSYLSKNGWTRYTEPRDKDNKKITVNQFLKRPGNDKGIIIAKVGSHHVSLIVNGVIWDTWDCTDKIIHTYFKNPNAKIPEKVESESKQNQVEKRRFIL